MLLFCASEIDQGQTSGTSWLVVHGGVWANRAVFVCLLFNLVLRHYFMSYLDCLLQHKKTGKSTWPLQEIYKVKFSRY